MVVLYSVERDFGIFQGDTYRELFTFFQNPSGSVVPSSVDTVAELDALGLVRENLTGASIAFVVEKDVNSPKKWPGTSVGPFDANGEVTVVLPTVDIDKGTHPYKLRITYSNGDIKTRVHGNVVIL